MKKRRMTEVMNPRPRAMSEMDHLHLAGPPSDAFVPRCCSDLARCYPSHLMPSARLLRWAAAPFLPWLAFISLTIIPAVQRQVVFLHNVRWPLFAQYDLPEHYGLAPYKTRNVYLNTSDGERLGAWHVLPRSYYLQQESVPPKTRLSEETFDAGFRDRPTVLYFHGNAATRALPRRVRSYMAFSTVFDCNVLAIDYRGFADSTGTPSEAGLLTDAEAAWDFVMARTGASGAGNVILVGQSLGTGVASGLAGRLADKGIYPRAVVLVAPFTSITDVLSEYWLAKFIPVLSPFRAIPPLFDYLRSFLYFPFNSAAVLPKTDAPILILHAQNDAVIPHSHSQRLFEHLKSEEEAVGFEIRLKEDQYAGWGTVKSFPRKSKGSVMWFEGLVGGHDDIGFYEGTLDLIGKVANL